jgi:translation initiation factor 3 subunit C
MHIPMEHLESAHLLSAMILEVPNMIRQQLNPSLRQRFISKALRKELEKLDRHLFKTPPEVMKENIIQGSKSLLDGDWQTTLKYLDQIAYLGNVIDVEVRGRN